MANKADELLANELLQKLTSDIGMEWRNNGSARFTAVARHEDDLRAIESAKKEKFSQLQTDNIYAVVVKHLQDKYDPFARTEDGWLIHPKDDLHKPNIPDSVRGLYLITQSHERQLEQLRTTLGASGLAVEKSSVGDECVRLQPAEGCRYVVKPKQQRQ